MIDYKTYNINLIKYIEIKISLKSNTTYWVKVNNTLKRIAKIYFFILKEKGLLLKEKQIKIRCLGLTRNNLQCKRKVENNYCFQHNKKKRFKHNLNEILLMDCVEGLKKIPKETASIIICDPPYNVNKDFGNNSDKQGLKQYLNWCKLWIKQCLRILRKDGLLYIYGFSEILANIQIVCLKKKFIRWIIWHYTNKVSPRSNFWQRSHESILCCSKIKTPYFNRDLIREPYTEAYKKLAGKKKIRSSTKGRFGSKETIYNVNEFGALPRDVIKIPALSGAFGLKERLKVHPTQKPIALGEKLIKSTFREDNLLIIPFAGTGSECIAAKRLKINFIAFEINKDYVNLANKELNKI